MSLQLSDVTESVRTGSSEVVPPNSFVIVTLIDSSGSKYAGVRIIIPPGVRYSSAREVSRIHDTNIRGLATLVKFT